MSSDRALAVFHQVQGGLVRDYVGRCLDKRGPDMSSRIRGYVASAKNGDIEKFGRSPSDERSNVVLYWLRVKKERGLYILVSVEMDSAGSCRGFGIERFLYD
jgi:hypothetical protein